MNSPQVTVALAYFAGVLAKNNKKITQGLKDSRSELITMFFYCERMLLRQFKLEDFEEELLERFFDQIYSIWMDLKKE